MIVTRLPRSSACLLIPAVTFAVSTDLPTRGRLLPGGLLQTSRDRVKVMQDCGFEPAAPVTSATSDGRSTAIVADEPLVIGRPRIRRPRRPIGWP